MGVVAPAGAASAGVPPLGDRATNVVSGTLSAVGPGKAALIRGPMNILVWAEYASALATTAGSLTATVTSAGVLAKGNAINSANVPPGTVIGAISGTTITLRPPPQTWYATLAGGQPVLTMQNSATGTLPANLATLVGATLSSPYFASGVTVLGVGAVPGTLLLSAAPTSLPPNGAWVPIDFVVTGNAITATSTDANATYTGAEIVMTVTTLQIERSFDGCSRFLPCNIGGGGQLAQFTANTPISLTFGEPEQNVYYRLNVLAFGDQASGTTIAYRISTTGEAATTLAVGTVI